MTKIAVFKTARITTMSYVIDYTKKKFPNSNITVISTLQIPEIYQYLSKFNTIQVNTEPFNIEKTEKKILEVIKSETFDFAVIPTEGNYYSYENVLKFAKNFLNESNIYYYVDSNNFYKSTEIKKNYFFLKIFKFISLFFSLLILFIMIFVLLIKSFIYRIKFILDFK